MNASAVSMDGGRQRIKLLAGVALAALAGVMLLPPLVQDPAYHQFADARSGWRVPNAWNVLSNLPFLLAGFWGLARCRRLGDTPARPAWCVAFAGIALVSLGSAWYHWAPSDTALVWDRLPMTIGFMGLLVAVLSGHVGAPATRLLLGPAVAVGIASVAYWHLTGDLRPYVWVQFTPLAVIATLLVLDGGRAARSRVLGLALVLYGLAKVLEHLDARIFAATAGLVSGHSLKHLCAAAACAALVVLAADRSEHTADC